MAMVTFVLLYNLPRVFEYSSASCHMDIIPPIDDDQSAIGNNTSLLVNNTTTASIASITTSYSSSTTSSSIIVDPTSLSHCSRISCEAPLKRSTSYRIVYENVLYCLVVFLGPFILLVFFNVAIMIELCRSRRGGERRPLGADADDRHERLNITMVMMIIIIIFLVTQTPAYINQVTA